METSVFAWSPFIAIWETTRACALACVHCRAAAIPRRDPGELTTDEGKALLDRIAAFGDPPPLVVLTGGDPLRRPDIAELVAHGTRRGLMVSLTPSATAAVTEGKLRALRDAGLARLAVSLDGAGPETHDAFRGVRGSHRYTLRIIERARALGLGLQVNTTVCRQTVKELPALVNQVTGFGVLLWALFFLIPVGRAQVDQGLTAGEIEEALHWAADLQGRVPFGIKTTEAPHYHRVLAEAARADWFTSSSSSAAGAQTWPPHSPSGGQPSRTSGGRPSMRAGRAVTDGNGFVFVDHRGDICPSGFLPLPVGNVRRDDLVAVYREHPLFVALRDPARLGGRCGRCEWRERCGGSRARAYALTGNPLAEDPGCAHEPVVREVHA
ncbi:MAG TPA: TIGR04053 family radical SAM/SPASM domain-containing protein [Methylomirabilota bacterium]|nr:TIGR04053 family radical SAM/SPASM domain-containing protein [Methylomirabilota bacterium]